MGNIDWLPIADIPDRLKDGRDLLVWDAHENRLMVGMTLGARWVESTQEAYDIIKPTHFAEISPPEGV